MGAKRDYYEVLGINRSADKDTIKKAWKRAESIRTVSAKSKDSDTKKDVSEEAKVAAKPAAQKKEEPEQLSLFNLGA